MASSRVALTKRALRIAFGAVILVLVSGQVLRYFTVRAVDRDVDELFSNALSSVRLLWRISEDLQRWRILIDRHILETDPHTMEALDVDIADASEAFDNLGSEYEVLTTYPGERATWNRLKRDVAVAERGVAPVLADSRKNLDIRARDEMEALEPRFAQIEGDIDSLVEINRQAGARFAANVSREQRTNLISLTSLTLLATLACLVIAWVVIPLVGRRQQEIENHALEMEARNRELDAFAGRVAHDLRGPLTAIGLSASRLSERLPRDGATSILQRGVRRMENVIEDLLMLSRIDAQVPGLASAEEVAHSVEVELEPLVHETGGTLIVEVAPARVCCNQGLLYQVLWNLGENARKYRRADVALLVSLSGRVRGRSYEFCVRDNGSGMGPEVARRAFEPFFRGPQRSEMPGTGLGLSIVKRVVEASGGVLSLESEPGQGTTICFTLPLEERV
jgi:signal transduction histidine kinase